jgi:hypothetical protein
MIWLFNAPHSVSKIQSWISGDGGFIHVYSFLEYYTCICLKCFISSVLLFIYTYYDILLYSKKTGVGYPQLSAVIECADAAHGLGGHIISVC